MNVKTIYMVFKKEKDKVYSDTQEVTNMEEGDTKGDLVVRIETGIQDAANLEMTMNIDLVDVKILINTTTTKL
jgi:hypothetical protein